MTAFDDLLPDPLPAGTEFWRGTVVQVSPLLVERVEGVMPATPERYTPPLGVGDRVFGLTINTRPVVIAKADTGGTPFAMAAGKVGITPSGGSGRVTVTLPAGRFSEIPMITATADSGSATAVRNVQVALVTANDFDIVLQRANDVATDVHWQAIQMTPTSAEG